MTNDVALPKVNDEYVVRLGNGETINLFVTSVAKRGRGYQVYTDKGKYRLLEFLKVAELVQ